MRLSSLHFSIGRIISSEQRLVIYQYKSRPNFRRPQVSPISTLGTAANCKLSHASKALFHAFVILDILFRELSLNASFLSAHTEPFTASLRLKAIPFQPPMLLCLDFVQAP